MTGVPVTKIGAAAQNAIAEHQKQIRGQTAAKLHRNCCQNLNSRPPAMQACVHGRQRPVRDVPLTEDWTALNAKKKPGLAAGLFLDCAVDSTARQTASAG
jgi:hypothetical protein